MLGQPLNFHVTAPFAWDRQEMEVLLREALGRSCRAADPRQDGWVGQLRGSIRTAVKVAMLEEAAAPGSDFNGAWSGQSLTKVNSSFVDMRGVPEHNSCSRMI